MAVGALIGVVAWRVNSLPVREIQPQPKQPEVTEKNPTQEIDTSGWKIYRNEKYGFEFKFPEKAVFHEFTKQKDLRGRLLWIEIATDRYDAREFNLSIEIAAESALVDKLNTSAGTRYKGWLWSEENILRALGVTPSDQSGDEAFKLEGPREITKNGVRGLEITESQKSSNFGTYQPTFVANIFKKDGLLYFLTAYLSTTSPIPYSAPSILSTIVFFDNNPAFSRKN